MTGFSSTYFKTQELVPRSVWEKFDDRSMWFITTNAITMLHRLRKELGPITVNDWLFGGSNQYRGFRPNDCTIGSKYSQHRLGNAFDCLFKDVTSEEAREYIRNNPNKFELITAIELETPHLHFDCRNWDGIMEFRP